MAVTAADSAEAAPRVGLVLAGGGIAGYSFHTASLGALNEVTGWDPRTAELIVGTSAGSSIGALVAGNVPVDEMLARILTIPTDPGGMSKLRSISGRDLASPFGFGLTGLGMAARELTRFPNINPVRIMSGLLPRGAVRTEVVGEDAETLHGQTWPNRAFWITAVNSRTGELTVFGRDRVDVPVYQAVEASCSVPALFRPVTIGRETYVDGGVRSTSNADLVLDERAPRFDLVVILSPLSQRRCLRLPSFNSAIRTVPTLQLRREVSTIRGCGVPVLVVEPDDDTIRAIGPNPMDPTRLVQVMVESSNSAFDLLADPELEPQLEILRRSAQLAPSPPDVAYPQPI